MSDEEELSPPLRAIQERARAKAAKSKEKRSRKPPGRAIAFLYFLVLSAISIAAGYFIGKSLGSSFGIPAFVWIIVTFACCLPALILFIVATKKRYKGSLYTAQTTGVVESAWWNAVGYSDGSQMYVLKAKVAYEIANKVLQLSWEPGLGASTNMTSDRKVERLQGSSVTVSYMPGAPEDAVVGRPRRTSHILSVFLVIFLVTVGYGLSIQGPQDLLDRIDEMRQSAK
jgi:hypothetical protein